MTLKDRISKIHDAGRSMQDATREEMADILSTISEDMMEGKATMLHSDTVGQIAHALMSPTQREADYKSAAAALRAIPSDKRSRQSRANGSKGKRPRLVRLHRDEVVGLAETELDRGWDWTECYPIIRDGRCVGVWIQDEEKPKTATYDEARQAWLAD